MWDMRQVADKSNLVFAEIFNAICVLGEKIASSKFLYSSAKLSDARRVIVELESVLQKEKAEVEVCLPNLPCLQYIRSIQGLPGDM